MRLSNRNKDRLTLAGVFIALALLWAGATYLLLGKVQLCILRAICGYPCPGCGLTHAGLFLLAGKISDSLRWNPFLLPIVFAMFIGCIPSGKWKFADWFRNRPWMVIGINVLCGLYFIYRLIMFYPQDQQSGPMYFDDANMLTRGKSVITELFERH